MHSAKRKGDFPYLGILLPFSGATILIGVNFDMMADATDWTVICSERRPARRGRDGR